MTRETRTFTQTLTYNVFEPGERVRFHCGPKNDARVWVVREFLHPEGARDEPTVFLEGRRWGVHPALLEPVAEEEE